MVVLVLAGLATAASPAFATPAMTKSSGSGAVAPFYTPIGNTLTSSLRLSGVRWSFSSGGVDFTCSSSGTGYIPATHTRLLVTRLDFSSCITSLGVAWTAFVGTSASSSAPFALHVRSVDGSGSAVGTLEIVGSLTIDVTGPMSCRITVGSQSVDVTGTNATRQVVVNDTSVSFTRIGSAACPASGTGTMTGTYTLKSDTQTDESNRLPVVTAGS